MRESAYQKDREGMVQNQLRRRGIVNELVLDAMLEVPRHRFVPAAYRSQAYSDAPLPIGFRQTISQPYIVALMTQLLQLKGNERVLEVGSGSGYQAAVLSRIVPEVVGLERIPALAERSRHILRELEYQNVRILQGDGSTGADAHGQFDGILVAAAAPEVPDPLKKKLVDGGRLVIPVGTRFSQILQCWEREGTRLTCRTIAPVAFVPLIGEYGWEENTDQDMRSR
ncbi:MAG: protein-L-isoaspartate(D-aspartate) O-methyltransferase [Anaerolineales bacterium]|nr:protein-L-isoaspartate(D-aspartate) O-methyltransferase [Anaerolineales bacterium]